MPSLFVASITVEPCATSICLPSTSIFSISAQARPPGRPKGTPAPWGETSEASFGGISSYIRCDHAVLVVDVVLEFVAEVLDETFHGQRRGVTQGADRAAGDIVCDRGQPIEVLVLPLAILDPIHHPPHPARPFAARRALAARLLVIEIGNAQQRLDHA